MSGGPHARAVACPMCNEKFFPASLPFHTKQCEKRRKTRIVNCPYCNVEVTQFDLPNHIKSCPKAGGGRQRSRPPASGGSGQNGSSGGGADYQMGPANFEADVLDDGRMRCMYCGRYFNPDRIDAHQQICGKLKSARPSGVDGQPTQNARRVFNSQAQRVEGSGQKAFLTPQQYKKMEEEKLGKARQEKARKDQTRGKWRREHEEFQQACQAGRGDETVDLRPRPASHGAVNDGMKPCPHCGRRFEPAVADRHIPICANVRNRPKPPPSPGPPSPASPQARQTTPRGRSQSPLTTPQQTPPGSGRQRQSSLARGNSCSSLPSLPPGTSPKRERPHGSAGRSAAATAPGGAGAQAARCLRNSVGRLPGLSSQSGSLSQQASSSGDQQLTIRDAGAVSDGTIRSRLQASGTSASEGAAGATLLSLETQSAPLASVRQAPANGMLRLGLRRSAMLFRLLSQVPRESLERELVDSGVDGLENFDEEALIEAILEKLA